MASSRKPTYKSPRGSVTLYLADCMDVLPTLPKVEAVITDPPYGIGESAEKAESRCRLKNGGKTYKTYNWDNEPISQELMDDIRAKARLQVIFGGNYYTFPPTSCWLVWNKLNSGDFADCELAWTNLKQAVRKIDWLWNGMIRKNQEHREHPTQKPLGVMEWCIQQCKLDKGTTILDPFMGSGTTGVAALRMGCRFIGIELEPKYFEIAKRRITNELAQKKLF